MTSGYLRFCVLVVLALCLPAFCQSTQQNGGDFSSMLTPMEKQKVPEGVIIVKGAWSSSSDSVSPVPEGYRVANNTFINEYFGLKYPLPKGWIDKSSGPPPSDTGSYMLTLIAPDDAYKGPRGHIDVMAQDMFFTQIPASNAVELIKYKKNTLQSDYKLELKPTQTTVAGRPFMFYAYWSPVAELHWYVLATEIRCHTVQFVLTSRDTQLLENLILDMKNMTLPAEANPTGGTGGGSVPVCLKDYAREENVIERVEPIFSTPRYNSVPVRTIIDKQGNIKHIHFLSAFPDQEKAIAEALKKWRFRPHFVDGQPVEVETGLVFGRAPRIQLSPVADSGTTD
jgi:Gram-negative bacterial TonB protein C-terminal